MLNPAQRMATPTNRRYLCSEILYPVGQGQIYWSELGL